MAATPINQQIKQFPLDYNHCVLANTSTTYVLTCTAYIRICTTYKRSCTTYNCSCVTYIRTCTFR